MQSISCIIFLMAVLSLAAACGSGEPRDRTFGLEISNRALTGERTFVVDQGDTVTFQVTADEAGSLHVHGYGHEVELEPGEPVVFAFTAGATGRFEISMHPRHGHQDAGTPRPTLGPEGEEAPLGVLEVRPR